MLTSPDCSPYLSSIGISGQRQLQREQDSEKPKTEPKLRVVGSGSMD
jgi:hypothetical protein